MISYSRCHDPFSRNSRPGGERIDIDADGNVVGLF